MFVATEANESALSDVIAYTKGPLNGRHTRFVIKRLTVSSLQGSSGDAEC